MKNWRVSMDDSWCWKWEHNISTIYTAHGNVSLNIYLKKKKNEYSYTYTVHNKSSVNNTFWTIFSIEHDVCSPGSFIHFYMQQQNKTLKIKNVKRKHYKNNHSVRLWHTLTISPLVNAPPSANAIPTKSSNYPNESHHNGNVIEGIKATKKSFSLQSHLWFSSSQNVQEAVRTTNKQ